MRAREAKVYYCEFCESPLIMAHRDTTFGRRLLLVHDPIRGCNFSGKVFYVPRTELTEFPADELSK
jgi:hypothetical protein